MGSPVTVGYLGTASSELSEEDLHRLCPAPADGKASEAELQQVAARREQFRANFELGMTRLDPMRERIKGYVGWLLTEPTFLREPATEPRPGPDLAQVERLLAAAPAALRVRLAVLAFTGMRSGERRALRPADLDLAGGWIHIRSGDGAPTKTKASRKVPVHPRLRAEPAASAASRGPWLFTAAPSRKYPAGGRPICTKKLNAAFLRLLERLDLPRGRDGGGFTIHSLRHFMETLCVNSGIPQRVIDTWLGHRSDRSMAAVYYRLSDADPQAFMAKVPFGAAGPAPEKEEPPP